LGTISVSLPADGTTADVGDYNTPLTTLVTEFNGNIDDANIKSGAAIAGSKIADASITNAKLSTTTGEIGGAWTDYSSSSTVTGWSSTTQKVIRYTQVGKTVYVVYGITGTSNSTSITFTVPIAAKDIGTGLTSETSTGLAEDNGSLVSSPARVYIDASANASLINIVKSGGTANWTNSGTKLVRGVHIYEAA